MSLSALSCKFIHLVHKETHLSVKLSCKERASAFIVEHNEDNAVIFRFNKAMLLFFGETKFKLAKKILFFITNLT